jgi:hypothetical protein
LNGTAAIQRVDPEVVPKAQRRNFTANYKSWVLEEADKCRVNIGVKCPQNAGLKCPLNTA